MWFVGLSTNGQLHSKSALPLWMGLNIGSNSVIVSAFGGNHLRINNFVSNVDGQNYWLLRYNYLAKLIGDSNVKESRSSFTKPVEDVFSALLDGPGLVAVDVNESQNPISDEERARQDALKQDPHHDLPDSIVLGSD